ncbi:MAG: DEAD/DEAH box helicase [Candidatus Pacebacteria bacterium]|nr:DEAD/DEAH box helicase [Candidatus Paceibacterota bacterium]
MAYTIKRRESKPKRNNRDSGSGRKSEGSSSERSSYGSRPKTGGSSSYGKSSYGSRPKTDSGSSSYGSRPRSSGPSKFGSRSSSSEGSSYGSRPRTNSSSEGSSYGSRPRTGGSSSYGKSSYGSRSGGSSSYGSRSGGSSSYGSRSGGSSSYGSRPASNNRRSSKGSRGENIDINRFIARAEVVTEKKEEVVKIDHKFSDFAFDEKLKEAITKKGYITPTPIQDKVIPFILKGRDVVGMANTGTGKTGAFLLPLITKSRLIPTEKVLILAPTRELAIQIADELKEFTVNDHMHFACCVGGMHIGKQIDQLRRPNNFVIGTPGRVKDLIQRKMIDTSTFGTIVLDEADRMLDMGFIDDMKWILSGFPKKRQTLFFSATLSPQIEKLIHDFLDNPEIISVRKRETSKNIDQDIVKVGYNENKNDVLCKMLAGADFEKVIIFGRTKRGVETLSKCLVKEGFRTDSIHGDKSHPQRQRALKGFKDGKVNILVATDVAARGLDIPNVTHVINFDTPQTYDDYIHRIGRTGRGDATGKALTFVEHRK